MNKVQAINELEKRIEELEKENAGLKESNEIYSKGIKKLRRLLDIVPYPLLVTTGQNIVSYINAGFSETFGWTLDEIKDKALPFLPQKLREAKQKNYKKLREEGKLPLHETQRQAKGGRILDVAIQSAYYHAENDEPDTYIGILRDITQEKKIARIKESMLRISMALPEFTGLRDRMNFISSEVKDLVGSEGAIVLLWIPDKKEFFTLGSSYENEETRDRVNEIHFPVDSLIAKQVLETGEPVVIYDTTKDRKLHEERDRKLGYKTRNLAEVPLRTSSDIIGVLGAINKKEGKFEKTDMELLNMIASTVALSCRNAKVSYELKKAYEEVSSLNRAKDKAINHLSHELRTPVAVIKGSLHILQNNLDPSFRQKWDNSIERIQRNLERISELEGEARDIMHGEKPRSYEMLKIMLEQCSDELATLIMEEIGNEHAMDKVLQKIEEIFGPKQSYHDQISLDQFVKNRIEETQDRFAHREISIETELLPVPKIWIPEDVIRKVFDGLLKNAIENTPDEGKIEVKVHIKSKKIKLLVRDYGVGINPENQRRIFEGFFVTQETMDYSSKRAFDFNAGGRGADLLRIKIFSELYHFELEMISTRCPCLPEGQNTCPGRISSCEFCKGNNNCHEKGGTIFSVTFPES